MSNGKVALVTGASSGIGRSIAQSLAAQGMSVFGTSRNPAGTEPIPGVALLALDVCQEESVRFCVEAVLAKHGRLDVLVNNAGYVLAGAVEDISPDEARAQFETNLFGAMRMIRAVLPAMRLQRSGCIVNISSLSGLVAVPPFCGVYSASKHALEAYSEHLRREVRSFNIRVSLVEPGSIRTNLTRNRRDPARPLADYDPWRRRALDAMRQLEEKGPDPSLVADRVLHIVRSDSPKLRYRVGTDATWVPRMRRLLPEGLFEKAVRGVFRMDVEA